MPGAQDHTIAVQSEDDVKKTFTAPAIRLEASLSALTLGAVLSCGFDAKAC